MAKQSGTGPLLSEGHGESLGPPSARFESETLGATERASAAVGSHRARQARAPVQDVATPPELRAHLFFIQAHRLMNLPHSRFNDDARTAFWAAIATLVGAYAGWGDLFSATPKTKFLDVLAIGVFLVCAAICIYNAWHKENETAEEYLNKLFVLPAPEKRAWWKVWR